MKFDEYLKQELPFLSRLSAYLAPSDIKTIFEVGCCEGEDSIKMSRTFKNAVVYAFEPLPHNIKLTKQHLIDYRAERVELHEIALSNKTGTATFHVSSGRPENATESEKDWDYGNKSSSLMEPNKDSGVNEWLKFDKDIRVKTERLDSFCRQENITEIDLIYMDVQGAELMVLEGAGKMLGRTKAVWLEVEAVELYKEQPLKNEVESFMAKAGFMRVMNTVGNISGDQLYVSNKVVAAKVSKNKSVRPKVSVLLPIMDSSHFIADTIESILNQSFDNFELLILHSNSSNEYTDIIERYKDPRVRIIENNSSELSNLMDMGVEQVSGEYVATIFADDIALPNILKTQLAFLEQNTDVALVGPSVEVLDETNSPVNLGFHGELSTRLLVEKPFARGGILIRKARLTSLGGFSETGVHTAEILRKVSSQHHVAILPGAQYGQRFDGHELARSPTQDDPLNSLGITRDYVLWLQLTAAYPGSLTGETVRLKLQPPENRADLEDLVEQLVVLGDLLKKCWYQSGLSSNHRLLIGEQIENTELAISRYVNQKDGPPPVSVVMSVYNGQDYLREAVQSILDQSFNNFEFIIIDDGSSDKSAEIIESFTDSRIRLIPQTNHGLVYSLNQGIKFARSKLIARMDADDISLPKRLEREVEMMNSNPRLGLVGPFFEYIDEQSGKPTGVTITSLTRHWDLRRTLYVVNPFAHGATMYRKRAVLQAGGYRDIYGPTEDYDLWRRVVENWEVAQIPEVHYQYRLNPKGISSQKNEAQQKFVAYIVEEQWNKPFVRKKLMAIITDAKYYKQLNNQFSDTLYNQYINEQCLIARGLLLRDSLKVGGIATIATIILDYRMWRRLVRPLLGCTLRKLKLRHRELDENTAHS